MSEIDANIIVEGQKTVATIPQDGEIIKDGGEIDATCIVEDSNGKRHKAVKIVNIDEELSDKSEIDAQVLNNNNELIMVTEEQDGEIIPQNNSEIDFHCLVQKDDGKQLSVKTVELDGEIIKTGGAIDASCIVKDANGKEQKAIKVFNLSGASDWKGKPADWSDIRRDCPANSIALYAGELGSNYIIEDGKLTWADPNLYLQTDGASYIDTGVIGKGNATTINFAYSSSNDDRAVFGARQASNVKMFEIAQLAGSGGRFDYNNSTTSLGFGASVKHICNTKIDGSYYTVERYNSAGVLQNSHNFTLSNFETPYTLDLFARNNNGTVNAFSTDAKIYYFKIYEDGVLVRHFVPVPSGLVIGDFTCPSDGMFDIVNQQFYANQGTGNFTFSKDSVREYDNLGFTVTCTGGYNVFIDGVQYGSTYASGAKCSITWSTSGITTGDIITSPSLLKAHKIWISPATEGNNITAFHCARVAASGNEIQGILWGHFNLTNNIVMSAVFATYSTCYNENLYAITAKNNVIKATGGYIDGLINQTADRGGNCSKYIEYLPIFNSQDLSIFVNIQARSNTSNLKKISLYGDATYKISYHAFQGSLQLEEIKTKKQMATGTTPFYAFSDNMALKALPDIDYSNATNMANYLTNAVALKDTILDTSAATGLTKIGCYGTSQYFMSGFKGLRVSNEAPFDNATSPQINVSYTGMDRTALVTLFNDLPTVSSGQIINITGCTGAMSLNGDDISIATNKGWTVVGGPALSTYYKYTNEQEGNIYTKDAAAKDGSVFTIDNISAVGNMRIENEIYSNFSSSNYLKLDQAFNPGSSHWEITLKYKTGTSGSSRYLFDSCKGLGQNGRFGLCVFISSDSHFTINNTFNGTDWSITSSNGGKGTYTVLANTDYWIKVGWDGSKYYLKYSLIGQDNDYTEDIAFSSTTATYAQLAYSYIGVYSSTSFDNPLNGTIDLSQTYYTIGSTTTNFGTFDTTSVLYNSSFEEFNPQPDFTVTNGSTVNTQIVGSSLIENNGVYSNFSDTSFIRLGSHNFGNAFNFKTRAKIAAYTSSSQVIMSGRDYDYEGGKSYFNIYITSAYKWGFELGTGNDSTWSISETSDVSATVDETYDIIFCYEEGYYRVKVSVAGQDNYTTVCEQASASQIMVNSIPVVLGINKSYLYYRGSIDIKETELTIDGATTTYWNSIPYVTMDNQEYDYSGTVQH